VTTVVDVPELPALVSGLLSHQRHDPVRHGFRHRVYQWLVDLDDVPRPGRARGLLGRFDARDHLSGRGASLKDAVVDYLRANGIEHDGGRIVMSANARTFGYVFDPLSVFWCFRSDGSLRCAIAEVHNTYGERHVYLLERDPAVPSTVDKEFYVSPFNDVSGRYLMQFVLCPERLHLSVTLQRPGLSDFTAVFDGTPRPCTLGRLVAYSVRMPFMAQRVAVMIRLHAIWLLIRRLPLQPRPTHSPQEGMQ
jgi:hypothetical protein